MNLIFKNPNIFILFLFILLQVLDGVLTYFGVYLFGLEVEGNPIIYAAMIFMGVERALILAKITGIALGFYLFIIQHHKLLLFFTGFYSAVVITWIFTLYFKA